MERFLRGRSRRGSNARSAAENKSQNLSRYSAYQFSVELPLLQDREHRNSRRLTASGNSLFYHTFKSAQSEHKREVDFLIARMNKICPIEVTSSGYRVRTSLDKFCQKYSSRILAQYLVYTKDYAKNDSLCYLPVYMVPFL